MTGYRLHCPPARAPDAAERDEGAGAAAGAGASREQSKLSQPTKLRATRVMREEDVFGLVAVERAEEADDHFVKDISETLRTFRGAPSWQPGALAECSSCDFKRLIHLLTTTDEIDPLKCAKGCPSFPARRCCASRVSLSWCSSP